MTGAGGESLDVEGLLQAEVELGGQKYEQEMQVGRLEELDLLLGMDWLVTYRVKIDCGNRSIRIGTQQIQFGSVMKVGTNDLTRLDKTIRIRPRGVQWVACRVGDLSRAGREVLVEGVTSLGDDLYVVSTLEQVREDGSIPLILENQGVSYKEIKEGLIVAKLTDLPMTDEDSPIDSTTTGSGERPPSTRIWQIACHTLARMSEARAREDSGPVNRFYRSEWVLSPRRARVIVRCTL
jgi:hypothetical protein